MNTRHSAGPYLGHSRPDVPADTARMGDDQREQRLHGCGDARCWDCYFMRLAKCVASRSRDDPQVGAVIVGDGKVVLSTGYNGFARNVLDLTERYEGADETHDQDEKLCWMCHAEVNAIFNATRMGVTLVGGTIYTTKYPCAACASAIVQVGIKRVFTLDKRPWSKDPYDTNGKRVKRIFLEARVQLHAPAEPLEGGPDLKKSWIAAVVPNSPLLPGFE